VKEALRRRIRAFQNHYEIQVANQMKLEPGDCIGIGVIPPSEETITIWDTSPAPISLYVRDAQALLKRRWGWFMKKRFSLEVDGHIWGSWDLSRATTLRLVWNQKVSCKEDQEETTVWADQLKDWVKSRGDMRVTRNNMTWDEETIVPGDTFEVHERRRGGSSQKKHRDPFSVKNFNPRMARRKRVEAAARELREQHQKEEELEESIKWKSTSVTYEGEEFIMHDFVNDEWNKSTARRFARWVRSFSGLER
jgi:hypothetical protein